MKTIKKMYKISIIYLVLGLSIGLFYHEAAYWTDFTGNSVLKILHPHAIGLGALMFLIIPLFIKVFSIDKNKYFNRFIITYNIGLIGSLFFMGFRGVVQLFDLPISSFLDHMIGGLAGISHIIFTIGIFFLYRTLISSIKKD